MSTIRWLGYIALFLSLAYLIITMLIEANGKIKKPLRCWFLGHKWSAEPGYFRDYYAELQVCKRCARKRAVVVKQSGDAMSMPYMFIAREFRTSERREHNDTNHCQRSGNKS